MIRTVDEFVDALGGNKAVKTYFKLKSPAISMWKDRRVIPSRYIFKAQELATANGLTLDPQIFVPKKKTKKAA